MKKGVKVAAGALALVALGLVGFVGLKVGTANFQHPDTPYPGIEASTNPAVVKQGEYLVHHVAHCSTCHGAVEGEFDYATYTFDTERPLSGGYTIKAGPFGTFVARNITPDAETGIGRYTDKELARMIRSGIGKDHTFLPMMRLAQGPMSDEDLTAIISYLRAQQPVKRELPPSEFGILAKLLADAFSPRTGPSPKHVPASAAPSVDRGEYLANGPAVCVGCHSPTDPTAGFALSGPAFSGEAEHSPDPTDPDYGIIAPNLTPDPKTGIAGTWDEEQFVKRMKGGRVITGSKMPWEAFAGMSDADLRSVYRYLKTVKPASRDVGPTRVKL